MHKKIDDGSVVDGNGRIVFVTTERFVRDICDGSMCFICGADPAHTPFNDEHVLPSWILAKYGLYSKAITLPNKTTFKYGQYKIPCCENCNTRMGQIFETPISALVEGGYATVVKHLQKVGPWLFFQRLALIFLKTHLKDKFLRYHLDPRKGSERISDLYAWEELHHVHCVARAFFTSAVLDDGRSVLFMCCPPRSRIATAHSTIETCMTAEQSCYAWETRVSSRY